MRKDTKILIIPAGAILGTLMTVGARAEPDNWLLGPASPLLIHTALILMGAAVLGTMLMMAKNQAIRVGGAARRNDFPDVAVADDGTVVQLAPRRAARAAAPPTAPLPVVPLARPAVERTGS